MKTMRLLSCLTLLVVLFVPVAGSANPDSADIDFTAIDTYITAQMAKHGLKGVSLAITQDEEILYLKSYGTAGQDRPMTPQTPMFIGSQSKSFTALAIAQLAEQELIDINAPVRAYLPWFAVADESASDRITLSHLLHHTSGLSDAGFRASLPESATIEDAVRALKSAELTAPVGTQFQYFNFGYDVLACIIETVSGQAYGDYVQQHIFDPLQMTHTYTDPALARQDGLAQGYSRFFGFTVPARQPTPRYELAAGYIISTAEDLTHFAIAMNNQGVFEDTQVLSASWMRRMFAPVQGYGMGWFVEAGHIYHGGANETFKTYVDLYPNRDLGIVLLINQGYMLDHFISAEQMFKGVSALALGNTPPPVNTGISVRIIGWLILALVLGLCVLHGWNIYHLRDWRERARQWAPLKRAWDVAISFIIPTVILIVVFSQVKAFFGSRFNLSYQLGVMFRTMTDISILMLVGSVPDYAQGLVKLYWVLAGQTRRASP